MTPITEAKVRLELDTRRRWSQEDSPPYPRGLAAPSSAEMRRAYRHIYRRLNFDLDDHLPHV